MFVPSPRLGKTQSEQPIATYSPNATAEHYAGGLKCGSGCGSLDRYLVAEENRV